MSLNSEKKSKKEKEKKKDTLSFIFDNTEKWNIFTCLACKCHFDYARMRHFVILLQKNANMVKIYCNKYHIGISIKRCVCVCIYNIFNV